MVEITPQMKKDLVEPNDFPETPEDVSSETTITIKLFGEGPRKLMRKLWLIIKQYFIKLVRK